VLECVVGKPNTGEVANADVALRTLSDITGDIDSTHTVTKSPEIDPFQHSAQHVVIALEILVTISGKDYVLSAVSSKIEVQD
jgi:hypothetical protein